ncbi:putative nuclease HARBI1, partial [Dissostichus eleginoides]
CFGAVIQAPAFSGSHYFNYKGLSLISHLAALDARYSIHGLDVGAFGRSSDGGTLATSTFGRSLQQVGLHIQEDALQGAESLGHMPWMLMRRFT